MYLEGRDFYYTGEFKDGKFNGSGQIYSVEKERKVFDGNFRDDKMHGEGYVFYDDGNFQIFNFENGKEVGEVITYVHDNGINHILENFGNKIIENCDIF